MRLLFEYIIIGAAHDDASRQYAPRCHPGTREAILETLLTWFNNISRLKSLFLISGPAGVGKSAIMQSFAESIADRVISVFVSRPNNRNNPNRIFTTIAHQLAGCIKAYRDYLVDLIATKPEILNKNMATQFHAFITEPFVVRKIGAGGPPMAILLDGLDEVEGVEHQKDIIRIISKFTQEYLDTPLAWIIASRPEFQITNTFKERSIQGRFESHSIFIDAPDARDDVRRFLVDSFKTIRDEIPYPTPMDWPGEAVLAKLAAASSGLFIFAQTAVRFIKDPDHLNPISRLDIVLSVIDRSKGVSSAEQPFRNLDNLYTEILSRISPELLPTTKLLLRLALSFRSDKFLGLRAGSRSRTLRGMSVILKLEPHHVSAALIKCISTLKIPPWEEADEEPLTFLHASFPDYLTDAERSGEFYIDVLGMEDQVLLGYCALWHKHSGENAGMFEYIMITFVDHLYWLSASGLYSFLNGMGGTPEFITGLLSDMGRTLLTQIVERHKPHREVSSESQQKHIECLNSLRKINMIHLCDSEQGLFIQHDAPLVLCIFVHEALEAWKVIPYATSNTSHSDYCYRNIQMGLLRVGCFRRSFSKTYILSTMTMESI
jgi:hypothetical protein